MQAEPHRGVDRINEEIQLAIVEPAILQKVIAFLSDFDYIAILGIYIEAIWFKVVVLMYPISLMELVIVSSELIETP